MINSVLDHLWQSTLFVAVAGLLTLFLKSNNARVRYGLWLVASLKFLLPLALLTAAGRVLSRMMSPPPLAPRLIQTLGGATDPFSDGVSFTIPASASWHWGSLLAAAWLLGFAVVCAVWARQWLGLRKIVRAAVPSAINAPLPVLTSPFQLEPGLVGVWSPILLLPAGIADHLSPAELEAIVAHEVCHWRRRDNFTAALHMAVEAIFWFYPLVWWLETRLIAERERACDEGVVAAGRDPAIYAESILKVCKFYVSSPLACASGVSGADLKKRMEEIMWNSVKAALSLPKKLMLVAAGVTALAIPLLAGCVTTPSVQALGPHPGTEAALRHQIEAWEKKQPAFDELSSSFAVILQAQQAQFQKKFDEWGALKSITFHDAGTEGRDVYLVTFANGQAAAEIPPLTADGKIAGYIISKAAARTDNGPNPGSEAAFRQYYAALQNGVLAPDILSPEAMTATNRMLPAFVQDAKTLGALHSLSFQKINAYGQDVYTAAFDHGNAILNIAPMPGGKLDAPIGWFAIHVTGVGPHPGTEDALRRYVEALEKGQPNYAEMTPQRAQQISQQLPGLLALMKPMGALKSVTFESGGANGVDLRHPTDLYVTSFENGKAEWKVDPLSADGKAVIYAFQPLP